MRKYCVLVLIVVASWAPAPAAAEESPEADRSTHPGLWVGPDYRYPERGVFERTLLDVVAVPATVTRWNGRDWAVFGGVVGSSVALILPTDPSPDVRIDRFIRDNFDAWFPDIWGTGFQIALWGGLGLSTFGTWGYALLTRNDDLAQGMSLMAESVAVSQIYHLTIKILTGRQGPRDGRRLGLFLGPDDAFRLFPAGMPSGHFATLYAVFGTIQAYWEIPLGWDIFGHALVGTLAATHIINHRHYVSEIIVGSAMGYSISHWVVRNRSTRYTYDRSGEPVRVHVVPTPYGVSLSVRF